MASSEIERVSGTAGAAATVNHRRQQRVHRRLKWMVAASAVSLATSLLAGGTARALVQRGHVFGGSFGEGFDGADKLSGPSALAVDEAASGEAAGDVYVLDSANNRVVRFGPAPEHKFIEAWGYGVAAGGETYERCTGDCRPGIAGFKKGQLDDPVAIAVDNASGSPSRGDVYVVANRTWKKAVIDKFSPKGELLGRLVSKKEEKEEVEGMIDGVAVDPSGVVWVEREDGEEEFALQRFDDQTPNRPLEEPSELEIENLEGPRPARPGFAVDSRGDVYTTYEPNGHDAEELEEEAQEIAEREKERKHDHEPPQGEHPQEPCERNPCLLAKLAIAQGSRGLTASPVADEVDSENTTGLAVDLSSGTQSSDDVYLDNATSVAAFTADGAPIQRFGSEQLRDGGGAGLAVDAASGEILVADASAGRIDVYVPEPPGPPSVQAGSVSAAHVTSTSAELRAGIDPGGAETRYRFQYGTSSCATDPSPCAEVPAPPAPGSYLGQGFGDEPASLSVTGLSPDTTYHLRVLVENRFAQGPARVLSEERAFTTYPSALEAPLPDGRMWELVSPADKHGASIEPLQREGGLIQAAGDGRSIAYIADAPIGENEPAGSRAPEPAQILSSRPQNRTEWLTRDVATPNEAADGIRVGISREYQLFAADLSLGLVEPEGDVPLSADTTEKTIYIRNNATCATAPSSSAELSPASSEAGPASCYTPLVTAANDTGEQNHERSHFANALSFDGATPDLRHVVLTSGVPLTAGASGRGLYEWTAGRPPSEQLQLLSVLPNGQQDPESVGLGADVSSEMSATAISQDGSRVIWGTDANLHTAGHLYVREVDRGQTLEVDEPDSNAPSSAVTPNPVFQTANAGASEVFFTDTKPLTEDASVTEGPSGRPRQSLYVFEPEKPAGERVTDLTPTIDSGEAAAVQGGVLGAGEQPDGSLSVYFVANGVLAEGAQPGDCRAEAPIGAGCNLYVVHRGGEGWEKPRLIARLSAEDAPDWGAAGQALEREYNLVHMTARVSPNGEYLAFMSDRSLTGYDNIDVDSGLPDEEVYLYHYVGGGYGPSAGSLICASCNPHGAQPQGVEDTEESGEGIGLLVDRPQTWEYEGVDHWLAASVPGWTAVGLNTSHYQSRYLSNEGRLFFNSADSLVPRDVNKGKEDVYEYEPTGVGGCRSDNTRAGCVALISSGESEQESAFLDASESGNDVFFLTSAKLSAQDSDTAFDVYDARVCGAAAATTTTTTTTTAAAAGAEPCPAATASSSPPCDSEAECRSAPALPPAYGAPASSTVSGSGNLAAHGEVGASKSTQPAKAKTKAKASTRAQRLARALKACKKKKSRRRRTACESRARKRYRAKAAAPKRSHAKPASAGSSPRVQSLGGGR